MRCDAMSSDGCSTVHIRTAEQRNSGTIAGAQHISFPGPVNQLRARCSTVQATNTLDLSNKARAGPPVARSTVHTRTDTSRPEPRIVRHANHVQLFTQKHSNRQRHAGVEHAFDDQLRGAGEVGGFLFTFEQINSELGPLARYQLFTQKHFRRPPEDRMCELPCGPGRPAGPGPTKPPRPVQLFTLKQTTTAPGASQEARHHAQCSPVLT